MNDQTLQLLSTLAAKIGTTTEYMWVILVKQAPISGLVNLLVMAFWIFCCYISFKYIKRKTTEPLPTEDEPRPRADWDIQDEGMWVFTIWSVITALIVIVIGVCLNDAISSIINPEYWALQKITDLIKLK